MSELTAKQEEYLLFFATMTGRDRYVSEAADYFEVSKPTASVTCDKLQKLNMVYKDYNGELHLTELGKQQVEEKLELQQNLKRWLQSGLGLLPYLAEKDARTMVTTLSIETIEAMLKSMDKIKPRVPEQIKLPQIESDRPIGFQINKVNGEGPSMGDRGFEKPATMTVRDGEFQIILKAAKIEYKPHGEQRKNAITGSLFKLWYEYKKRWYEVEMNEDNDHVIPYSVISLMNVGNSTIGTLKIRARATVGMMKMPESEAMILFDFKGIEIK